MNGLSSSADEAVECPLCMEPLEVDDLNFYPCTCGYQICRFCWHRIRTDENELCPACRKAYPENPADFTPLTQEEMIAFKSQKRQRDQQRKQKITENRKHLANVRVVQKNLVFVVGLPPRLADADILKKHEYFGKYGKIHKVVINPSTTYAGVQGPSASAYVTYVNNGDALRAIQSVNNINIDGRPIKTSLGTTKYCSHFMKNQQCPKSDCMYLHELGDPEASFTKEEMHQGKHQEYEKRLHETLLASSTLPCNGSSHSTSVGTNLTSGTGRNEDTNKANGNNSVAISSTISSSSSSSYVTPIVNSNTSAAVAMPAQHVEAWPSLSVSPINKDSNTILNGKNKRDKLKQEKYKNEKSSKVKGKFITSTIGNITATNRESIQLSKNMASLLDLSFGDKNNTAVIQNKKNEKTKSDTIANPNCRVYQNQELRSLTMEDEVNLIEDPTTNRTSFVENKKNKTSYTQNCEKEFKIIKNVENTSSVDVDKRSLSSSSNISIASSNSNSSSFEESIKRITSDVGDNYSVKSSPASTSSVERSPFSNQSSHPSNNNSKFDINTATPYEDKNEKKKAESSEIFKDVQKIASLNNAVDDISNDNTVALSNMNLFDDHNSFFSSSLASLHQSMLKRKVEAEMRQNNLNASFTSQLPDLLSGIDGFQTNTTDSDGIDGFQTNTTDSDDLQNALKNMGMIQNNKQLEGHLARQLNQHQHQMHQQLQQQEGLMRIHEMQTKHNLINGIGISQISGPNSDLQKFGNTGFDKNENNRLSQTALLHQQMLQQQQQAHQSDHVLGNNLFGVNMSKFFDFHKNQQQQINQQLMLNGGHNNINAILGPINEHLRLNTLLENKRFNSQYLDRSNGILSSQQQQLQQNPRLKYDSSPCLQQSNGQPNMKSQQQVAQSRITNQFSQNTPMDDDLGFDPFIETQKALAELMENEQQNVNIMQASTNQSMAAKLLHQQQHHVLGMQRSRMPPPGFNHMNAFAFGVPRQQNTSKILPFTNSGNSIPCNTPIANGNFNSHMAAFPQQPQLINEPQMHQLSQNQNSGNQKVYSNNDWTAMDPAILSFRQFSFPQQSHVSHTSHQQDYFLQNAPQQQNISGFGGSQAQLHYGNMNLPSGMMNSQQASPGQVNANVQGMLEYLKNRQFI